MKSAPQVAASIEIILSCEKLMTHRETVLNVPAKELKALLLVVFRGVLTLFYWNALYLVAAPLGC